MSRVLSRRQASHAAVGLHAAEPAITVYKSPTCGCCTEWADHLRTNGYVIEGHVPADDITRLLAEKPDARGLTVPGMPAGSPGMESPTPEHYQVLLIDKMGKTTVFASH